MGFINEIKKTLNIKDENGNSRGWVVRFDKKNLVNEVIQLYNPKDYGSKVLNDDELLEILIKDKANRNENKTN
jgi:hypothetical protein|tara:strand:- start:1180 stop:1398 length:219 start_codon:yes stop_codon:yes gene_type:complete